MYLICIIRIIYLFNIGTLQTNDIFRPCNLTKQRPTGQLHCVNCGVSSLTILPCPRCPDVHFCSPTCLIQNLQGSHRYECDMRLYGILRAINRNVFNDLSVGKFMALRLVTQKPPTFFIKMKENFEELLVISHKNEINHTTHQKMEGYDAMLKLACAARDEIKIENQNNFAGALIWLLDCSKYFSELPQPTYSTNDCFQLKSLLFRLIIKVFGLYFIKLGKKVKDKIQSFPNIT